MKEDEEEEAIKTLNLPHFSIGGASKPSRDASTLTPSTSHRTPLLCTLTYRGEHEGEPGLDAACKSRVQASQRAQRPREAVCRVPNQTSYVWRRARPGWVMGLTAHLVAAST